MPMGPPAWLSDMRDRQRDLPDWINVVKILADAGADIASIFAKVQDIAIDISESGRIDVSEALECRGCCLLQDPAQYAEAFMAASRAGQAKMAHYICTKRPPTGTDVAAAISAAIKTDKNQIKAVKN